MGKMEIKELYKKLKDSGEFKDWKKKHPKEYLVHFFKFSEGMEGEWQIGYYSKETDKITTFLIGEQVGILPEEEVFKKDKTVKRLNLNRVKIDEKSAFKTIEKLREKEHREKKTLRTIVILQHLGIGQVWNITYITAEFNTLNFKVDAENGKVISHELVSLVRENKK